jgi:hypothetical protein
MPIRHGVFNATQRNLDRLLRLTDTATSLDFGCLPGSDRRFFASWRLASAARRAAA